MAAPRLRQGEASAFGRCLIGRRGEEDDEFERERGAVLFVCVRIVELGIAVEGWGMMDFLPLGKCFFFLFGLGFNEWAGLKVVNRAFN